MPWVLIQINTVNSHLREQDYQKFAVQADKILRSPVSLTSPSPESIKQQILQRTCSRPHLSHFFVLTVFIKHITISELHVMCTASWKIIKICKHLAFTLQDCSHYQSLTVNIASLVTIIITGIVLSTSARGPCFNSPAIIPSECKYVNSLIFYSCNRTCNSYHHIMNRSTLVTVFEQIFSRIFSVVLFST